MARRKDHLPEELKELATDAVLSFLQSQPANQLSLRKVAKLVGYSPGTLINLFGSYAFLLLAANAKTLDRLADDIRQAMYISPIPEDQLYHAAKAYLNFARQHPYQWQILFEHHLNEDEDIPQWQISRINDLFAAIEQLLAKINPAASHSEQHKVSRVIWAAVHGICMLEVDDKLFAQGNVTGESMIQSLLTHYLGSWKSGH